MSLRLLNDLAVHGYATKKEGVHTDWCDTRAGTVDWGSRKQSSTNSMEDVDQRNSETRLSKPLCMQAANNYQLKIERAYSD